MSFCLSSSVYPPPPPIEHTFGLLSFTSGWAGPWWDNWIAALKQIELSGHWAKWCCCMLDITLGSTQHYLFNVVKVGLERRKMEATERRPAVITIGVSLCRSSTTTSPLSNMIHKLLEGSVTYLYHIRANEWTRKVWEWCWNVILLNLEGEFPCSTAPQHPLRKIENL